MRITNVITDFHVGGAEWMLARLSRALRDLGHECTIISLMGAGPAAAALRAEGFDVRAVGMHRGAARPRELARLARELRRARGDVVQTWLYHADLLGGLAARLASRSPVVWGIHHTTLDPVRSKRSTRLTRAACAALSRVVPAAIVCCSETALRIHADAGYARDRMVFVPNGFEPPPPPDPGARLDVRRELGIPPDARIVGMVARFDPQKGHDVLFRAVEAFEARGGDAFFVLCGSGVTASNAALAALAGDLRRFRLLGMRDDVPRLLAAFDVATLSSHGEAFPLVVGEAMSHGVPCVVTDVGDSAAVVGDSGVVVPPGDPAALAEGWLRLLGLPAAERAALGARARERIEQRYSIAAVARRYAEVYERVVTSRPRRAGVARTPRWSGAS
jgi:glycosyltransferase involved in cell wall biosynthesis